MKRISIFFILAALLLSACAASAAPSPEMDAYAGGAPAMEAPMAPEKAAYEVSNVGVDNIQAQERLVIQNADLVLVVTDPKAKLVAISQLAQELGGFVVASNLYETTTENGAPVPAGSLTIRIPAEQLENALARIKTDVIDVQSENRTGQDVTNEYVDLQSRLKARQAAEAQLLKMMEQSQNAEDTLAIFNQLTQLQSEIEVLKGQIKYYEEAAAMSAISIRLVAEASIQPIEIGGWKPQGVARDAVQALVNFFKGFVNFLIWLIIFIIPVGAVIIFMLALLWRLLRWFWRKVFPKKTPAPAPVKTLDKE